jgi:hypothetical protein
MTAPGPKQRSENVCFRAAVGGKQTFGQRAENGAYDPTPTSTWARRGLDRGV